MPKCLSSLLNPWVRKFSSPLIVPFTLFVDEEDVVPDNNTNVIKLKIKRIKRGPSKDANEYKAPPTPKKSVRGGHTIALVRFIHTDSNFDLIVLLLSYGNQRPTSKQLKQTWSTEAYDPAEPEVYVTFVFKYRPLGKASRYHETGLYVQSAF